MKTYQDKVIDMLFLRKGKIKKILIYSCLIIFFSIVSMAYADEKKSDKKETNAMEKKQKVRKNPTPFIPSEKINADSSISFPIDI